MGILIFLLTDQFLDGKFSSYGTKSIAYLRGSLPCTEVDVGGGNYCTVINPMCSVFPTTVRCEVVSFGVGKDQADVTNHICTLGQNLMNQKI